MEIKLRHEKTSELTGIDLGIDQTEIKMLKAGIPLNAEVKECPGNIVVSYEAPKKEKEKESD